MPNHTVFAVFNQIDGLPKCYAQSIEDAEQLALDLKQQAPGAKLIVVESEIGMFSVIRFCIKPKTPVKRHIGWDDETKVYGPIEIMGGELCRVG
jgi:ketopantoate hydroxymethyltransferase